jgi:hypothetical protein
MASHLEISSVELQEIAERIRSLRKRATEHSIEIGRELVRVKARLPHGDFVKWVEAQCEFKIRMAQDLMKLARDAAENPELAAIMTPSTLRIYLSNRSTSAVRDLVSARVADGRRVSRIELRTAIARAQAIAGAQTTRTPATNCAVAKSAKRAPTKSDLLTAGEIGSDTELDKSRRVAELLLQRLSRADFELLMDGMTWGVWNRVLVWLRADQNVISAADHTASAQATSSSTGVRAA